MMDTAQREALAAWNTTRSRRSQSPMEAAEQDHRVALADAHDAYVAALARAARDLLAAADRADRVLAIAQANQRGDDRLRARMAEYYQHRPLVWLRQDQARFLMMVTPGYMGHRDATQDRQASMHVELITAELERRAAAGT